MANYTAADVKRLRELTGSGMMACKNASGQQRRRLRQGRRGTAYQGRQDVGKRAERSTAEGPGRRQGRRDDRAQLETDFVAKNAEFQELADKVLDAALAAKTSDVEALKASPLGDGTVNDTVQALAAKIGEKLELRRVAYYDGPVAVYLHKRASDLPPGVGVLVSYTGEGDAAAEAARNAAQQVAAPRRATRPATRCPPTSSRTSDASPRRPPRPRASPSRRCRRSSKAASTASTRTSSSSTRRMSGLQEDGQERSRRGRCHRRDLHPLRGRPELVSPISCDGPVLILSDGCGAIVVFGHL